jgi:predicted secreted protein with PEFG-CTERM motif
MRIELRDMIKNGAPSSEVNQKIDAIISDMDIVQVSVPEFGTVAMMILAVAIISIIAVTAKTKMIPKF